MRKIVFSVAAFLAVLFLGYGGLFLTINDGSIVARDFSNAMNKINLNGDLIASKTRNAGCKTYTVKFGKNTVCKNIGFKVYKNQGSLIQDLLTADSNLTALGFPVSRTMAGHRSGYTTSSDYINDPKTGKEVYRTFTDLESSAFHNSSFDIYSTGKRYVFLFAAGDIKRLRSEVTELLNWQTDFNISTEFGQLKQQEYLYGIVMAENYFEFGHF